MVEHHASRLVEMIDRVDEHDHVECLIQIDLLDGRGHYFDNIGEVQVIAYRERRRKHAAMAAVRFRFEAHDPLRAGNGRKIAAPANAGAHIQNRLAAKIDSGKRVSGASQPYARLDTVLRQNGSDSLKSASRHASIATGGRLTVQP